MRVLTRLFLAIFLAFTFAVLGATVSPGVSSAEDVWVLSRHGFDNYMVTDSIKEDDEGFRVSITIVRNGNFHNVRHLRFCSVNESYMLMEELNRTNGNWTVSSDDELGAPLWEAMKPYMDDNGIDYPNLGYK